MPTKQELEQEQKRRKEHLIEHPEELIAWVEEALWQFRTKHPAWKVYMEVIDVPYFQAVAKLLREGVEIADHSISSDKVDSERVINERR